MAWRYAGRLIREDIYYGSLTIFLQARQPCRVARRQVQAVSHALRTNGKHLPLLARLPDASA
jgi:hypothetical protein